jgi:hypothetical protein
MLGEDLFSIPFQKGRAVIANPTMMILAANTVLGYIAVFWIAVRVIFISGTANASYIQANSFALSSTFLKALPSNGCLPSLCLALAGS